MNQHLPTIELHHGPISQSALTVQTAGTRVMLSATFQPSAFMSANLTAREARELASRLILAAQVADFPSSTRTAKAPCATPAATASTTAPGGAQ